MGLAERYDSDESLTYYVEAKYAGRLSGEISIRCLEVLGRLP